MLGDFKQYKLCTGSRLTHAKSSFLISGRQHAEGSATLPNIYRDIPTNKMSYLHPPQIKYLGINSGFQEEDMRKSLEKKLNYKYHITKKSYSPSHQKVIGYNTYIIFQIYCHESMCSLTSNQIQTLEKSFTRQNRKVAYISMDTFKTLKNFGGFDMTDLNIQIRYIKANYPHNIL